MDDRQEGIAFIGNTLGPLFYYDPQDGMANAIYEALAGIDPIAASKEWPFCEGREAQVEDALQKMREALTGGISDDLVWEHRRLFVGPAAKAAPPWGSVYTDRDCVIFGQSTLDLRKWMRENGVAKLSDDNDPEDHIGSMLMMLAWMAQSKPDLTAAFLQGHLLTWAPHFLGLMEREAKHAFYEGLASLTALSLEGMRDHLELEVQEPRFYR